MTPRPIEPDAFAPYGSVIEAGRVPSTAINGATCERFDSLALIDAGAEGGSPVISIFRAVPWPTPIIITMLERHPLGSQAFYPLHGRPWLVVVGQGDPLVTDTIEAFHMRGDQGIQFSRGVWHHPLIVLDAPQDFLVVDRAGPGDNCDEIHFDARPIHIDLDRNT